MRRLRVDLEASPSFPVIYATATALAGAGTPVAPPSVTSRSMLKISGTPKSEQPAFLKLEGQVRGPWVEELRRACDHLLGKDGSRETRLVLDLAEVSFLDAGGITLLHELTARRVLVTNCSPFVAEQLKEVADVDR